MPATVNLFFDEDRGEWVLGSSTKNAYQPGQYARHHEVDEKGIDLIGLKFLQSEDFKIDPRPVTQFAKDKEGNTYESLEEFLNLTAGFFFRLSASGMYQYQIPFSEINGISDENGVITGTNVFDLPGSVNFLKPILVFCNGIKVTVSIEVVGGITKMTMPTAPLGDTTVESSLVEIFYFSK